MLSGLKLIGFGIWERRGGTGRNVTAEDMKALRWVKPVIVVEIGFVEWTAEALLRHSTFVGIRDDKPASAVHREP